MAIMAFALAPISTKGRGAQAREGERKRRDRGCFLTQGGGVVQKWLRVTNVSLDLCGCVDMKW